MAIFESLANALRVLAVGDRVKVTLRPETGQFPESYGRANHAEGYFRKLFVTVGTRRHSG